MSKSIRKRIRTAKKALEAMCFADGTKNPLHGKRGGRASQVHKSKKAYSRRSKHKQDYS